MATKKAASTKKASARKPAAAKTTKTTVRTVSSSKKVTDKVPASSSSSSVPAAVSTSRKFKFKPTIDWKLPKNWINIVLAELFGTFILGLVALATLNESNALYIGIAYMVMVLGIGAISGAHLNPAVTLGVWSVRKLKSVMIPIYWASQFLGVILALVVSNWVASSDIKLNFSHFLSMDWQVFGLELVGTAVFLFAYTAVTNRTSLSTFAKAFGIGASLTVGLVVATSIYTSARNVAITNYQKDQQNSTDAESVHLSHMILVKGAVLNPAVAVAVPDDTESALLQTGKDETPNSRFSVELILGSLIGAVLGSGLYALLIERRK